MFRQDLTNHNALCITLDKSYIRNSGMDSAAIAVILIYVLWLVWKIVEWWPDLKTNILDRRDYEIYV